MLDQINGIFLDDSLNYYNNNLSIQKGVFAAYVIASALIFYLIIQMIILGLNTDIWKAKRLLALFPSQKIFMNIDIFKTVYDTLQ